MYCFLTKHHVESLNTGTSPGIGTSGGQDLRRIHRRVALMTDHMIQSQPGTDEQPLGSISLSLSGGGGRAAGFHLGTLAYLDRVKLLKDVSILSSVSGGSHVAAKYALTLKTAPVDERSTIHFVDSIQSSSTTS